MSNIIRLPDPAEWNLAREFLQRGISVATLRHAVEDWCVDEYRMHRITANVVAGTGAMQRDGF